MQGDANRYRELVEEHGLSRTHQQVIEWVPEGSRVLELGCAGGYIGELLVLRKGCSVVGAEIDPVAAAEARGRGLQVHMGSLDDPHFLAALPGDFDVVLAADVLEHLRHPEGVLAAMPGWLVPEGRAIIAVPNVATWSMRVELGLHGRFQYQDTGLLDRTHLRFYTWNTILALVRRHGWAVEATMADSWELPGGETLMWSWPKTIRQWIGERPEHPRGTKQRFLQWLHDRATRTLQAHDGYAERLGRRLPNLCAVHVALLLRRAATG